MTEFQISELTQYVREIGELKAERDRLQGDLETLRSLAQELAAKHVRGDVACTACAAVYYGGGLKHNDFCPVARLGAMA